MRQNLRLARLHKAKELPKEAFTREVECHLTGQETEFWEIIYFKLYKSQLPVVEQALETAALMLGTDKSRGYCMEMMTLESCQSKYVCCDRRGVLESVFSNHEQKRTGWLSDPGRT
jgi:hypothetical protein